MFTLLVVFVLGTFVGASCRDRLVSLKRQLIG